MASSLFRPRRFALCGRRGFFVVFPRVTPVAMTHPVWQFSSENAPPEQQTYFLTSYEWTGCVDTAQPARGLQRLTFAGRPVEVQRLLGASIELSVSSASLTDCYVRGDDLIAVYEAAGGKALRSQLYWRRIPTNESASNTLGIELIASVQTELLHSEPCLKVVSEINGREVCQMASNGDTPLVSWKSVPRQNLDSADAQGGGVFVIRGVGPGFDFVQSVHPSDLHRTWVSERNGVVSLVHELFAEPLEKGVMRRGRVRCWLRPQTEDVAWVADYYRAWLNEPPPLTT